MLRNVLILSTTSGLPLFSKEFLNAYVFVVGVCVRARVCARVSPQRVDPEHNERAAVVLERVTEPVRTPTLSLALTLTLNPY